MLQYLLACLFAYLLTSPSLPLYGFCAGKTFTAVAYAVKKCSRMHIVLLMLCHHRSEGFPARSYLVPAHGTPGVLPDGQSCWDVVVAVIWKFRSAFRPGNYIWSLSLWIWTQMRHLGTLIPRFCTEFRYLSYGQSGFACGAIFEKVPKYQETPSFFKICMSIFPGTGSQNEFFPTPPPAAFSNVELEGRSPSKMQGGVWGAAALPASRMLYLYFYFI